ncbi:MAG: hypothetical protein AB7U62_18585 [Pseudolabrys sp.]
MRLTTIAMRPTHKTMLINVRHPGAATSPEAFAAGRFHSRWPHQDGMMPRAATVVIIREDGGVIGA